MKQYFDYYNNERCHLAVGRDSPNGREIQNKPFKSARIISFPRIGGLHHMYKWNKAAQADLSRIKKLKFKMSV